MSMWSDTPRLNAPPQTKDLDVILGYVKDLANTVAKMAKDLEFIVNGNLDANNIRANSIETKNLKANSITTEKIQAGAVIAEKIDVHELSAISANLGHIVAGLIESVQIYGSYIATRRDAYPRCEMSNTNNMFGAYRSLNNFIQIYSPAERFSPVIKFEMNGKRSYIFYDPENNDLAISSNDSNINISTQGKVKLYAQDGVYVTDWNKLKSNTTGESLEEAFVKKN